MIGKFQLLFFVTAILLFILSISSCLVRQFDIPMNFLYSIAVHGYNVGFILTNNNLLVCKIEFLVRRLLFNLSN
jgi:hypothetical protein